MWPRKERVVLVPEPRTAGGVWVRGRGPRCGSTPEEEGGAPGWISDAFVIERSRP